MPEGNLEVRLQLLDQTTAFRGWDSRLIRTYIKESMKQFEEMGIEFGEAEKLSVLRGTTPFLPPTQWMTVARAIGADRHDMLMAIRGDLDDLITDTERGRSFSLTTTNQLAALMRRVGKIDD